MTRKMAYFIAPLLVVLLLASCSQQEKSEKTVYTCPMHPQIKSDRKGQCPICGMDLVPAGTGSAEQAGTKGTDDSVGAKRADVPVDENKERLLGIKYGEVKKRSLAKELRTSCRLVADERKQFVVSTKYSGWVEKLYADYEGIKVVKGQPLLEMYSEELFSAQGELISALNYRKAASGNDMGQSGEDILSAARKKLGLLGVSDEEISRIEAKGQIKRTVTVFSPASGYVLQKNVLQGEKIERGAPIMKIVDLSTLWALGGLYQEEASSVHLKDSAVLTIPAFGGREFPAAVTYISPSVDAETRTFSVRSEVDNREGLLKPEMFGDLVFTSKMGEVLSVPESAVIRSGSRDIVFVRKEGSLKPETVALGRKGQGFYEVLGGLREGDDVVLSANFLLDSESQLKALIEEN